MATTRRLRRRHSVSATVKIHQLSKAGTSIDFAVFADEEKVGTLIVGRGSITWYGRNRRKPIELSWTRFSALMDREYSRRGRRPTTT